MKKYLISGVFAISALFAGHSFAADTAQQLQQQYVKNVEAAYKSTDIQGGLVKACIGKYQPMVSKKALTAAEVNKLCQCEVKAEGSVTNAQMWAVRSAVNAKNTAKAQQLQLSLLKQQGANVRKCVGTALDKKIAGLIQQAMPKK